LRSLIRMSITPCTNERHSESLGTVLSDSFSQNESERTVPSDSVDKPVIADTALVCIVFG